MCCDRCKGMACCVCVCKFCMLFLEKKILSADHPWMVASEELMLNADLQVRNIKGECSHCCQHKFAQASILKEREFLARVAGNALLAIARREGK